jgi:predicted AlkP superfamily phosphohydrolase/phosphomutase
MKPGRWITTTVLVAVALTAAMAQPQQTPRPHVIVVGVNGMEWDIIRPLVIKGQMPNLAKLLARGVYGKLKTVSAPNCPKVYTAMATSAPPEENGITGFRVRGETASTKMLTRKPLAKILSEAGVSVGLVNVPATFPAQPVNGYVVTGMLTRGTDCEDGILCSPKLTDVSGGEAVYPASLKPELLANVGDFHIDCARMPAAEDLKAHSAEEIDSWLKRVTEIRTEQTKLFEYLLKNHPTDFTMLVQSCEDRTGHWLYPIQPHNVGYNEAVNSLRLSAFPDQYRAFDEVLGRILQHVDANTYVFVLSDHGIKPLREFEQNQRMYRMAHDHGGDTPIIANHDFEDGDDVPGVLIVMGPDIKRGTRLMGFAGSVYDIAPTILKLYGIAPPAEMKGKVLAALFEETTSEKR